MQVYRVVGPEYSAFSAVVGTKAQVNEILSRESNDPFESSTKEYSVTLLEEIDLREVENPHGLNQSDASILLRNIAIHVDPRRLFTGTADAATWAVYVPIERKGEALDLIKAGYKNMPEAVWAGLGRNLIPLYGESWTVIELAQIDANYCGSHIIPGCERQNDGRAYFTWHLRHEHLDPIQRTAYANAFQALYGKLWDNYFSISD